MIRLKNVSVYFGETAALYKINLRIKKGEFVYIVGSSGAGKTTLLRTIYMDIIPNTGFVQFGKYNSETIKKRRIPYLRRRIGNVFQDFKLLEDRTILENAMFAVRVTGATVITAKKRAIKALTSVGLLAKKDKYPHELSGGENQRACIARALANDPVIILADEPTGNLDLETGKDIFKLLKKINENGTAVVTATHNYQIINAFPGRIIFLEDGIQVEKSNE